MSYLLDLKDILGLIPTSVWLAVVGLVSVLLGATVGQWGVTRQLRHDAEQRRLDREMAIRREVYLGAVEGMARLQEYLGSFAKTDMKESDRERISSGAFGLIKKAYLVGRPETIRALLTLFEVFARAAIYLGNKQIEVMVLAARAVRSEASHEEAVRRTQQLGAAVTSVGQTGRGDLLEPLLQDLKTAELKSQMLLNAGSEASSRLNQAKIGLIMEMSNQAKAFEEASENALILVRRELGFQIDEEEFRKMMNSSGEITQKLLTEWTDKLREVVQQTEEEFGPNQ